eukprot:Phypoly_transcript_14989.p1 GENE.Phypoly_transcript_14989~~Phypoly_transcript_14989.p1  ORF type:complete len:296 (+),score=-2.71 Phypoly_transcript_14989:48-890(+)
MALIASYSSPKHRKFPNIILVWICIADLMYALFLAIRWVPGPVTEAFDKAVPGSPLCTFMLYILVFIDFHSSLVSILISYTLYASIVNHVSYDLANHYHKWYMLLIWVLSASYPFVNFIHVSNADRKGLCSNNLIQTTAFRIVPWVVMFCIQLWFAVPVLKYVTMIKATVKNYTASNSTRRGQVWLYLRFMGIIVVRFIFKLIFAIYYSCLAFGLVMPVWFMRLTAFAPLLLSVNAFVVLAGNSLLYHTFLQLCAKIRTKLPEPTSAPDSKISDSVLQVV